MLFFLLLACASDEDSGATEPWHSPEERGPYLVGSYEDVAPGPEGLELPVQVWFPASEADEDLYAYDGFFTASALDDGQPDCSAQRPVMVFSHGNSGIRYQSVFLTEHLASHGWVVVAPDHLYNTMLDIDYDLLWQLVFRRPLDVAAAFDWLAQEAAGAGGQLQGCVDESAGYAVAGHSFGGYTTVATAGAVIDAAATAEICASYDGWLCDDVAQHFAKNPGSGQADLGDPHVWAAIPMAPAGYEALVGGLADVDVPTMVLGGSMDDTTTMEEQVGPIFEGLQVTPRYLGEVQGAGHYGFSDACNLVGSFDECGDPYLAPEEVNEVVRTVSTAFLAVLLGDEQAAAWLPPDDERLEWTAAE